MKQSREAATDAVQNQMKDSVRRVSLYPHDAPLWQIYTGRAFKELADTDAETLVREPKMKFDSRTSGMIQFHVMADGLFFSCTHFR